MEHVGVPFRDNQVAGPLHWRLPNFVDGRIESAKRERTECNRVECKVGNPRCCTGGVSGCSKSILNSYAK